MEEKPSSTQKGSPDSSNCKRTDYQDEDETEPLTFPFFSVILSKSHIRSPYTMNVPAKFHGTLHSLISRVELTHHGKTWEMDYVRNDQYHRKFSSAWKNFAFDNSLNVGDGCVFELVDQRDEVARFKVQILRGEIPKGWLDKMDSAGDSAQDPIIL